MSSVDRITGNKHTFSNNIFSRYADTNGDGSGTKSAIGNYSGGQEIFYLQPPVGQVYRVHRLLFSAEDTSGMTAQEYGNLAAPLTNGIEMKIQNDTGTITDLTDGVPIKTNGQWGRKCFDADLKTWGNGDELIVARWTFSKSGSAIVLSGSRNDRLEILLNDDFTGLISQYFLLQGNIE